MSRPRILAVTSEPPWPLDSGGHLRTFYLLKSLASRADLRLLCPAQPHEIHAVGPLRDAGLDLRPVLVRARTRGSEVRRMLGASVRSEPYVMYRRHAWPAVFAAWRRELAAMPDALYLDHLDSYMYVSGEQTPQRHPAVIDLHNVYSLLARRAAESQASSWRRVLLHREARRLARIERQAVASCQSVFAVSDSESEYYRQLGAAHVATVPNGVNAGALSDLPVGRTGPPIVMFLGSLSWRPNVSAVQFLASTVLPALRQLVPETRLLIVGRNPAPEVQALHGGPIDVAGPVPDVKPYLLRASVLAVPLDAGGGTRLKILEAFAAGLPVVSTRVGAEGINATSGTHFLQAERPDFAAALAPILTQPASAMPMAAAARDLASRLYDWRIIGERAADQVLAVANSGRRHVR